jgi:hypothetical protein
MLWHTSLSCRVAFKYLTYLHATCVGILFLFDGSIILATPCMHPVFICVRSSFTKLLWTFTTATSSFVCQWLRSAWRRLGLRPHRWWQAPAGMHSRAGDCNVPRVGSNSGGQRGIGALPDTPFRSWGRWVVAERPTRDVTPKHTPPTNIVHLFFVAN